MSDQKRDVERLIEDGLIRYGGGDLAGALAAWERALLQEPGNLQALGYIDYVRQVFDQLNRPTHDELVVPFGLGHGDTPDYQIEISPEPPDDDSVQPSGGLQDGWPITADDERDTVERLYAMPEPPGTLDLELDEPRLGEIETLSGKLLEDTVEFGDITPVQGIEPHELYAAVPPDPPSAAPPKRLESEGDFDGPELEITPGFLENATSGFGQLEPTPGFGDSAGHSTDLKRPDLGFVKPRHANTVSRKSGVVGTGGAGGSSDVVSTGGAGGSSGVVGTGGAGGSSGGGASAGGASAGGVSSSGVGPTGDEAVTSRMQAVRPSPPSLFGDRTSSAGSYDDRDERRDSGEAASRPSRPGLPRSDSRSSKPALVVPAERQSRPALAASVEGRGKTPPVSVPAFDPAITAEFDSASLAAAEREPTRPRQAVSALLGANLGNATPTPRPMAAVNPTGPESSGGGAAAEPPPPSALSGRPAVAPGLLDPWSAVAEANAGGDYSNLELAPFIEELPPSTDAPEAPPGPAGASSGGSGVHGTGRPGLPGISGAGGAGGSSGSGVHGTGRPETMTRNLGLAGRYQPRDDLKFGEESPTRELARPPSEEEERTRAWASVPGMPPPPPPVPADALEALSAQILPKLERDVPPDESRDDRLRRRITSLVELAADWSRVGDPRRAVAAVDLALAEDPDSALAQKLIHRNREAIMNIFQGYLGSLERRPTLARSLDALGASPIGARAAFLLSRVDGHLTYDEILDVSGMPRLEAYRYLCQLLIRGILTAE